MSVLNWGIIGLGKIADKFASGFDQLKNSRLYSLASKNRENLEEFQKKYNVNKSHCYNNYEDMLLNTHSTFSKVINTLSILSSINSKRENRTKWTGLLGISFIIFLDIIF